MENYYERMDLYLFGKISLQLNYLFYVWCVERVSGFDDGNFIKIEFSCNFIVKDGMVIGI